jgi:hypothetical protein
VQIRNLLIFLRLFTLETTYSKKNSFCTGSV